MENKKYYLGLDIGTNSVGYAATDTTDNYNLIKFKGKQIWGVSLFDEANLADGRRAHRAERRRLDRRQQRVQLVREIFAEEIAKIDPNFYRRIDESSLLRVDAKEPNCLFNDADYSDKEYHKQYPTIHHLITDLLENKNTHDARLVYIACAWLVAHRGHFLSDISVNNIEKSISDFAPVYSDLMQYLENYPQDGEWIAPWNLNDEQIAKVGNILKLDGINKKFTKITGITGKLSKKPIISENGMFPFSAEGIIKLICGGKVALSDLYANEEYKDLGSLSLDVDDEKWNEIITSLDDDGELLLKLKAIYDWATLNDLLAENKTISHAKVAIFNKHSEDLKLLKNIVKEFYTKEVYDRIFRDNVENNYVAYSGKKTSKNKELKNCNSQEEFCKFLKNVLGLSDDETAQKLQSKGLDVERIQNGSFLPKQVNTNNRVIPYQLYYVELEGILRNASEYLQFLNKEENGLKASDKLLSIMSFRIPYYVGPLNGYDDRYAWIRRKAEGAIRPWNFEDLVDLDECNKEFINRMTNKCSYLAGEDVLAKNALLYRKFEVLNEINNIKIRGVSISVEQKQAIFNGLFLTKKKVTPKNIKDYLAANNMCSKDDVETLSGIDTSIKSSLSSYIAFSRLLNTGVLTTTEVEDIIKHRTYTEDKIRFKKWIDKNYSKLADEDKKYVTGLSFSDFGRLSEALLNGIKGSQLDLTTGEIIEEGKTVIDMMWEHNVNLSELLLSEKYTFNETIRKHNEAYYEKPENQMSLNKRLDEMYVSNAVKRPIIRALDVVRDVVKATGCAPEKIFVEMARGSKENQKGKRTKSRKEQLIELYKQISDEDVREISKALENESDNRLQSDKLFLYYTQLGKCMYTGKLIDVEALMNGSDIYNIDHIYPQAKVTDDSVLNNKVLVLSAVNGTKKDIYPIDSQIRNSQKYFWEYLRKNGLINETKFNRLVRATQFSEEEEWGFISRQMVETRQSTKVVTLLLNEKYPNTEIVYVKAGLVSEFRHENNLLKSRTINDLHHAKDAYLNVVCGNIYHEHFTRQWFLTYRDTEKYTVNMKTLLKRDISAKGKSIWSKDSSLDAVKKNVASNHCNMTYYSVKKTSGQSGGLFDQNPLKAGLAAVPRKKNLPQEKYGGYDGLTTSFSVLVQYKLGKKTICEFVPVQLLYAPKFIADREWALNSYVKSAIDEKATDIKILLDGRIIKIGTVFELDGLRVLFGSQGSKTDKRVWMKVFSPLQLSAEHEIYVHDIEAFVNKTKDNDKLVYSESFDKVNSEKNIEVYDILIEKMGQSPYSYRPENQQKKLIDYRDKFKDCDVKTQCKIICNVLSHFNRTALSDTETKLTNVCRLSPRISNWTYKNVIIVDMSPSGIWERKINLTELL